MKKLLFFAFISCFVMGAMAQSIIIAGNPGTSPNIVFGSADNHASESIYTNTELGGAGITINNLSFDVNTVGAPTIFNGVNIYLKDVATATLATGAYNTAGYTLVYTGSVTQDITGFKPIVLTTPFTHAAGQNLQMLIERAETVIHSGFVWNAARGNNTGATVLSSRRYNGAAVPVSGSTSLTATAFRPALKINAPNNDLTVLLYTLGKLPITHGSPHIVTANVSNLGLNTLTNVNVVLNVTGANTFTDTQVIPSIAPGTQQVITFAGFTPTAEGNNTLTVSVPADDDNTNNTSTITPQIVNKNTWSYAIGTVPTGGIGFGGAGDMVAKFNTSLATAIAQITVNFTTGGNPYQLGIWDATGLGGTPGAILYNSATLTSAAGVNVIPVTPAVTIPAGDFYVGVRQTTASNVSFAYQAETPIRTGTFYFRAPVTGPWNDFAPSNPYRFMIEPKLILPIDAAITGFNVPATTSCYSTNPTYTAILTNAGANDIAPGAAAVTLKVRGANTYTNTLNNTTNLISGASETITFNNVNISNPGQNFDTVFVVLAGDAEQANDSATDVNNTATTVTNLPFTEKFSGPAFVFGNVDALVGNSSVVLQNGPYSNIDLTAPLAPFSPTRFIYFDNYSEPDGTLTRLYSDCIVIPGAGPGVCGNHKLSFYMSHDDSFNTPTTLDSMYVTITTDGGATWTRLMGYGRYDAAFTVPGWKQEIVDLSPYAGQTVQIGFEGISHFGNIIGLDDVEVGSQTAESLTLSSAVNNGANLTAVCDDQGWTYYAAPTDPTRALISINWDPTNTGANAAAKAAATPSIQLDQPNFAAEDIPAQKATYTMKRYWNVNLNASAMTAPVNLRFFYDPTEKTATDAQATAFVTANGGVIEPPSWFKTTTGAFVGDAAHVTPDGVLNSIGLTNTNTSGTTINGVLYAQFNGITSFSGGTYATGVGAGIVVPLKLEYFRGTKQANSHLLNWKVDCADENVKSVTLEVSADARTFKGIYSKELTSLTCAQSLNYTNYDLVKGINYYRLKITGTTGRVTYSNVVALLNADKGFEVISLMPNPVTDGNFKINITSAEQANMVINIADVTGRIVSKQNTNIVAGFNTINMNTNSLAAGTYTIFGVTAEGRTKVLPLIIR